MVAGRDTGGVAGLGAETGLVGVAGRGDCATVDAAFVGVVPGDVPDGTTLAGAGWACTGLVWAGLAGTGRCAVAGAVVPEAVVAVVARAGFAVAGTLAGAGPAAHTTCVPARIVTANSAETWGREDHLGAVAGRMGDLGKLLFCRGSTGSPVRAGRLMVRRRRRHPWVE